MAYREMELTLLSAQELKNVNLITRMDVYAVVSISGDPLTRQCTEPDLYGGRNPTWNETFRFAVPPTAAAAASAGASLHVLLRAERFLGDRDVGEVVVPLADLLGGAAATGPLPPQVASFQVRKLHRWEPRGVLNVSYRLGPVVAPVAAAVVQPPAATPAPDPVKAAANFYAPVAVPQQPPPYHHHEKPLAAAYPAPPPPPPPPPEKARRPAARAAEHAEAAAAQQSPVMGVPQQAWHPPAKPDSYRPPTPPPPPAVHAGSRYEAAPAPAPASPAARNGRSNGFGGQPGPGPTHVYMGPQTQIIFSGGLPTAGSGSVNSPARGKGDGNWAFHYQHDNQGNYYASAAESVISTRRKEDRWRPSVLSPSQQQKQAASSPVAIAPYHHSLLAASPFSSRSSSFSSSAHPSPHHPSTTTSPSPLRRSPAATAASPHHPSTATEVARRGGAIISLPSPSSSSPLAGPKPATSSPLPPSSPSSSPLVPNHSSMVPSL